MHQKKSQIFYLLGVKNSQAYKPNAYIYDETYGSQEQKNKFEHNKKFAYFNTILKIRKKLQNQKHQIYSIIFHHQYQQQPWKNLQYTSQTQKLCKSKQNSQFKQSHELTKNKLQRPQTSRQTVKYLSFDFQNTLKKQPLSQHQTHKPKLEDIMAQYRKINKKDKLEKHRTISSAKFNRHHGDHYSKIN